MHRRALMAGLGAAGLAGIARSAANAGFDAVIGGDHPTHSSLAAAIAAAPDGRGGRPWRVRLEPGVQHGRLVITQPDVHLLGTSRAACVISASAAAGDKGPDGQPLGTTGCATMIVRAPGFAARNLTIENGFDYLAALENSQYQRTGPNGAQAVALMLDQGADRNRFSDCTITGHQDTLFVDQGRSLFEGCTVTGSVDFIFGAGRALFQRCEVRSRYRPGLQRNHGFVTAPSTPKSQRFGLVFRDCRLTREDKVPPASVVLGRPWRPGRSFADGRYGDPGALGASAFLRCFMDDHISADGWDEMGYQAKDGGRTFLEPDEARFAEYASTGPGAFKDRRRRWMSPAEAAAYTPAAVLAGWSPGTSP